MTTVDEHSAAGLSLADTIRTEDFTIGAIAEPNSKGDTRIMWDSRNKEEVKQAQSTFDGLVAKGYRAYAAEGKDGHRGALLDKFDPKVERIILIKQLQGG